jgi:hypothetical protein
MEKYFMELVNVAKEALAFINYNIKVEENKGHYYQLMTTLTEKLNLHISNSEMLLANKDFYFGKKEDYSKGKKIFIIFWVNQGHPNVGTPYLSLKEACKELVKVAREFGLKKVKRHRFQYSVSNSPLFENFDFKNYARLIIRTIN